MLYTDNLDEWYPMILNRLKLIKNEKCDEDMPPMNKFITIEGNDYAGKTTFTSKLKEVLESDVNVSSEIILHKFPGKEVRKLIREGMTFSDIMKFQIDVYDEMNEFLDEHIWDQFNNKIYLIDRFYLSSIAYMLCHFKEHLVEFPHRKRDISLSKSQLDDFIELGDNLDMRGINIILLIDKELVRERAHYRGIDNIFDVSSYMRNDYLYESFLKYRNKIDLVVRSVGV